MWELSSRLPALSLLRPLRTLAPRSLRQAAAGRCLCLDHTGRRLVAGDDLGRVAALSRSGKGWRRSWWRQVHQDSVYTVRLIHEERHLLSCSLDARISLLDAVSGEPVVSPYTSPAPARCLSVERLRIRRDLAEACDLRYLERRGALVVEPSSTSEDSGLPGNEPALKRLLHWWPGWTAAAFAAIGVGFAVPGASSLAPFAGWFVYGGLALLAISLAVLGWTLLGAASSNLLSRLRVAVARRQRRIRARISRKGRR